jgi:hypothetical protein
MRPRGLSRWVLFCLLAASAASRAEEQSARRVTTPAYLPRAAWLGAYFNTAVTIQVQIQWEFVIQEQETNAWVLLLGGGGGYGLWLPGELGPSRASAMLSLYQHSLRAGAGFRTDERNGLHWGVQLVTGPLFYGARFQDLPADRGVAGLLEARGQLGQRLGSSIYGLTAGYVFLYLRPDQGSAVPFLGGWLIGLFADRL